MDRDVATKESADQTEIARRLHSEVFITRVEAAAMDSQKFDSVAVMSSCRKRTGETTTTVAVPDHSKLKTGTLSSIIRQSGLARTLFES